MNPAENDFHWLAESSPVILSAWVITLGLAVLLSVIAVFLPAHLARAKRILFFVLTFPALLITLLYGSGGAHLWDRPVVHWIFRKDIINSLHLGVFFDPLSFLVSLGLGLTLGTICFRNRPAVRVTAALVIAWAGLSLVATSKTIWMAALGLGLQMMARILPIITETFKPSDEANVSLDSLWTATSKRAWIAFLIFLTGGLGLASQGFTTHFAETAPWTDFENTFAYVLSASLLIGGLILLCAPALSAHVFHEESEGTVEEGLFIHEAATGWSAVLITYRLLANIRDTPWSWAVGISATVFLLLSLVILFFLRSKRRAIYQWLSCVPLLVLTILPFLNAQEAFLWVSGTLLAFAGCMLCFDHSRSRLDQFLAGVFFCGIFGFVGFSSSAGALEFFSKIEAAPVLVGCILIVWTLYAAAGFRLVLRGGEKKNADRSFAKWGMIGLLFLVTFGPLLSGRWSGGGIPEQSDWLSGAKDWHWIKPFTDQHEGVTWIGFSAAHASLALGVLLGTFVAATATLFPFADAYPKTREAATRLFGVFWIFEKTSVGAKKLADLFTFASDWIWDRAIPATVSGIYAAFQTAGVRAEGMTQVLTSEKFGRLFSAPAKLVQWLHGGNVRLYAWFALIWVLIFSVYLTR